MSRPSSGPVDPSRYPEGYEQTNIVRPYPSGYTPGAWCACLTTRAGCELPAKSLRKQVFAPLALSHDCRAPPESRITNGLLTAYGFSEPSELCALKTGVPRAFAIPVPHARIPSPRATVVATARTTCFSRAVPPTRPAGCC